MRATKEKRSVCVFSNLFLLVACLAFCPSFSWASALSTPSDFFLEGPLDDQAVTSSKPHYGVATFSVGIEHWSTGHEAYEGQGFRTSSASETARGHLVARMYDPADGRFISRDPIGYLDGYLLYQYVRGEVLKRIDPSGHFSESSAKSVVACFLASADHPGRIQPGFTDKQCNDHMLKRALGGQLTNLVKDIGLGVIFGPVEGIAGGFWQKLGIEAIKEAIGYLNDGEFTHDQIVDKLMDKLGSLTPDEYDIAKRAIDRLLRNHLKDLPGECRTISVNSRSPTRTGGTKVSCQFLVCAKTRGGFFGGETVLNWKIKGGCSLTCTPTRSDKCCCGKSRSASFSASGSGSSGSCNLISY